MEINQNNQKKFEPFTVKNSINMDKIDFKELTKIKNPIIFDTNFLFVTFTFKIDIISQLQRIIGTTYSLYIYEGTLKELETIEQYKTKNKRYLPLIIKMLHIYNFKIIKSKQEYVDDQILENLSKEIVIATNDKKLRQEIQKKQYKVLYLRQKSYFEIK